MYPEKKKFIKPADFMSRGTDFLLDFSPPDRHTQKKSTYIERWKDLSANRHCNRVSIDE